jgi:hypothetical protein
MLRGVLTSSVCLLAVGCGKLLGFDDFTDAPLSGPEGTGGGASGDVASTGGDQSAGGAVVGGGSSAGGSTGGGGEQTGGGTLKEVFVTSNVFTVQQIQSVSEANVLCQKLADDVALGGVWQAWLSDSQTDASDNVTGEGPWARRDGSLVFLDRAHLLSTSTNPAWPIDKDEKAAPVPLEALVWTGTLMGGIQGATCTNNAGDWQPDPLVLGTVGVATSTGQWTAAPEAESCDQAFRLYCFEL